jgi:hypothetical protein
MPKKVTAEAVDAPVKVTAEGGEATVLWRGMTRVYSKEVHGSNYKKLAEEFASKVEGEVV